MVKDYPLIDREKNFDMIKQKSLEIIKEIEEEQKERGLEKKLEFRSPELYEPKMIGKGIVLYEGNYDCAWTYNRGVIVRKENSWTACRDDSKKVELYDGNLEWWYVHGNGLVVKDGNFLIACRDDGAKIELETRGKDGRKIEWLQENNPPRYKKGILIDDGYSLYTCNDSEKKVKLCDKGRRYLHYRGGLIVFCDNEDNQESKILAFKDPWGY